VVQGLKIWYSNLQELLVVFLIQPLKLNRYELTQIIAPREKNVQTRVLYDLIFGNQGTL
jgi:hypothetical protein